MLGASVRLQLHAARAVIAELDAAQGFRALSEPEIELGKDLKCRSLGLVATLSRTIAHASVPGSRSLKRGMPIQDSSTCRPATEGA